MTTTLIHPLSANKDLVFGLEWRTLIGSDLEKKSHQEAMRSKSTHYVKAGLHTTAVGCAKLNVQRSKNDKRALYSAAAVFALSNANGAFITKVQLEDDLFWVVGAHDGIVIKGTDVLLSSEEADTLVEALQERFQEANLISDERDSGPYLNDKTKLFEAKTSIESLPTWVKYAACVFTLLMIGKFGFDKWTEYQEQELMANDIEKYVDVNAEWKKSLDKWAESIYVDGPDGYDSLFAKLMVTPPEIGYWTLVEATCNPRGNSTWTCQAKYARGALGTNKSFIASLPKGWTAKWSTGDALNTAIGTWSFTTVRHRLDRGKLTPIPEFNVEYISALQQVLYAFKQVSLTQAAKVEVEKPKVPNSKGEMVQVPYPDNAPGEIAIPSVQKISANGPLRSLAVLPITDLTTIKSVRLVVKSFDIEPSLASSALLGELTGEMYVK